jgi:hypothetical protein
MWRMLPAFWLLGLLAIAFGVPLWRRRVQANPYLGLRIGEAGERGDVWYPVNAVVGRSLVLLGVRVLVVTTALATIDWRAPRHYVVVAGCVVLADAILFAANLGRLAVVVRKLREDDPEPTAPPDTRAP